jgi:hypothetical protein
MKRMFFVFVWSVIVGWAFRLTWDLNHFYHWFPDGDFFWGVGYAVILFGCAIHINNTINRRWFKNRWAYIISKTFTQFFFYTAISNLCDELFFNPNEVSAGEWITASIMWGLIHYYNAYYDRLEGMGRGDDR